MNKYLLTGLLSLGVAGSALAQTAVTGDLILGFKDNGSDGGTNPSENVTFDIGQYTAYQASGAFATGGTVDTGINVGTLLSSTYGSGWATDTGLLYGVAGANNNNPGAGNRTLFISANATGSAINGVADSTAWNTASSQSSTASKMISLITGQGSNGFNQGGLVVTGGATSWTTVMGPTAGKAFSVYADNNPGSAGNFEQTVLGNASDLYQLNQVATSPGSFLGTFSIGSNGDLDFTAIAIPEPSTYAAILGAIVLGVAAIRRRKQSFAL
jgi:hypothetical protein